MAAKKFAKAVKGLSSDRLQPCIRSAIYYSNLYTMERDITPMVGNQMKTQMENETETAI